MIQIVLFVLAVLIFVSAVLVGLLLFRRPPSPLTEMQMHAAWQTNVLVDVAPLLQGMGTPQNIATAKEKLLALTVAASDREAHLALVMAVFALERNDPNGLQLLRSAVARVRP